MKRLKVIALLVVLVALVGAWHLVEKSVNEMVERRYNATGLAGTLALPKPPTQIR
jgi:hypothetical protein